MAASNPDNRIARVIRLLISIAVVMVVLLIYPYTPRPTVEIKWLVVNWAGFVTGALWLLSPFLTREPMRWPRLFGPLIAALLALFFVSSLVSPYTALNLHETRKFAALALAFGAAAYAYRTGAQVRSLMLAMCFAVAVSSIYGFFQRAGIDPFPWDPAQLASDEYRNLPGTFGNPNYAAHAMVLTIILSIYLSFVAGWRWCVVFLPIFGVHLILTEQRAGLIALAVAAVFVVLARASGRVTPVPARRVAVTMLATGGVAATGAVTVMGFLTATTGSPYPLDQSLLIRYQAYVSATGMILDRPVLGFGPASYSYENPPYWTQYEQQFFARELQVNEHVHCDPIELAVDAGVPAASVYLILLTLAIAYGLYWFFAHAKRPDAALGLTLAAAFTAFAVDGLFGFNLRVPVTALFLFLLLGALEGVWRQMQEPAKAPAPESATPPRWGKPLAVILVLAALVGIWFDTRYFLGMRDLQTGRAWSAVGQHDRAQGYFARAQARIPWHWRIAREQAQVARVQRDLELAAAHAVRSVELHPHSVFVLSEAAEILFSRAVQIMEGVRAAAPEGTTAADFYEVLDEVLSEPIELAERAAALCPYYASAHESLGRMYSTLAAELERVPPGPERAAADDSARTRAVWRLAAHHLEEALHHGARNRAELYHSLALARMGERDLDGVQEALGRAIAGASGTPNWGMHLYFAASMGQFDALANALQAHIDELLETPDGRGPQLAEAYRYLGRVRLEGWQDRPGAEEAYRRAVRAAPSDGTTWRTFAEHVARHGGDTGALQRFILDVWQARESLPEGLPPHIVALALAWQGDAESFAQGAAVFSRFLLERPGERLAPRIVQDMSWAADILIAEAQALPEAGAAPARARLHTGIVQSRLGRYEAGLNLLRQALPQLPAQARIDCRVHMAHALIRLERPAEAARELERAVEQEPSLFDLWVLLARTYRDAGQIFEARRTFDAILRDFDLDQGTRGALEEELRALGR